MLLTVLFLDHEHVARQLVRRDRRFALLAERQVLRLRGNLPGR
jgi:hypothetical protein